MTTPKRIAIIGTGSMGSVYAALLASAGHDVWAVDAWAEHVAAMRAHGLRVEGKSGDRTVRLNATTEAGDVGEADLVIIATKADGVEAAARAAAPRRSSPRSRFGSRWPRSRRRWARWSRSCTAAGRRLCAATLSGPSGRR